jgi:hypothetical protein
MPGRTSSHGHISYITHDTQPPVMIVAVPKISIDNKYKNDNFIFSAAEKFH